MIDLYDEPAGVDEPNMVECEHCGEVFDKIDIDDEDICPECKRKITMCEECGERIFTDEPHYTNADGLKFCNAECWSDYLNFRNYTEIA